MKLYCIPPSYNSRKVTAVIRHLGLPVEIVPVDPRAGQNRTPEYLALNPMGRMPTFVDDDGFVLWESNAIMEFLAAKRLGDGLLGAGERGRADVSRWLFWSACHWAPACGKMIWERFFKGWLGRGEPNEEAASAAESEFRQLASLLDAHLDGRDWVAGAGVTIADYCLAAPLPFAAQGRIPVADFPRVAAWYARVEALPAWKESEPPRLG